MSIANNMSELDTVAANNHPRGTEAASLLDDGIRSNGAILKQLGVLKNATFSGGTITIGLEGGVYQCNPTADIGSILGGYPSGVFTLVFINSTAVNLSASSTIETPETIPVKVGTALTVTKLSTGVFKVLSFNPNYTTVLAETGTRLNNIETKNTEQDATLVNHANSINSLNSEVAKRNQIVWGYVDGNGYYANNYISNMNNALLHTAINLPVGVWEVTAYGVAQSLGDGVKGSVPIGLVRSDGAGISTPPVFQQFNSDGFSYMPVHFKGIVDNNTGADQNYRLRFGTWVYSDNGTIGGLFGNSLGEQKMYAIRLY